MALPPATSGDPNPTATPASPASPEAQHPQPESTPLPAESAPLPVESAPLPVEFQDPRIRRTRQLLQQSLAELLRTREFDKLSVQEITDAAGLNRATFYAHYPDKFALLECMVAARFHALLDDRGVHFDGTCTAALTGIVLGVCDFLAQTMLSSHPNPTETLSSRPERSAVERPAVAPASTPQNQLPPHMESAIVAVVRRMLLDGLRNHPPAGNYSPELLAATASWAIYGAAKEWIQTPNRPPSEAIATTVQRLIAPLLNPQPA